MFSTPLFGNAEREFHSLNGKKIKGIVEKFYPNGDILLRRSIDNQLFRIKLDIFTEDDQAFVKNNFAPNRDALPEFKRPLSQSDLTNNARYIDSLIEAKLKSYNLRVNKQASEEVFLRRAYLKIIGRIPSIDETKEFLEDRDRSEKRTKLIDKLLSSEGYVSNWFHFWADILRAKDNFGNRVSGRPFIDYIKNFVASNQPYDEWVREMLSSTGAMWERGNGGVGYFARDRGMPLDNMSNTVRVFLGTSLECAQCHDHPFDRWTQKQFYEMAAFTEGAGNIRMRSDLESIKLMNQLGRDEQRRLSQNDQNRESRNLSNRVRDIREMVETGLASMGTGKIRLPLDYQYDNASPGAQLEAKTIFGLVATLDENLEEEGSRASYAKWLATETNPRFTTVIVNRLWKEAFGLALIEPLDNMFDDTMATDPVLQEHLEKVMVALNYDLKEFLRIIYNTQAFQREAPPRELMSRDATDTVMPPEVKWVVAGPNVAFPTRGSVPYFYQGPVLERMSGEQLWDSLVTLNFPDIDSRKLKKRDDYASYESYLSMSGEELFALAMAKAGLTPGASAAMANTPPIELNPAQKKGVDKVLEFADIYCMSCHDSGRSRGDVDIERYHENPASLAASPNMLKMLHDNISSKQMPPPRQQLQPTDKERDEIVKTIASLMKEAPEKTVVAAVKFGPPINTTCPLKPGRAIDPSLLALDENGETVGFCCQNCLNRFKAQMIEKAKPKAMSASASYDNANYVTDRNSIRASELQSPAPNGHIIREFGGSDREQIEGSHKQASVTQVLNLLNGYVETSLLSKKDAPVIKNVEGGKTVESKINNAFLAILNREPTSVELRIFKDGIRSSEDPTRDLIWSLVNSHEFLFVQ